MNITKPQLIQLLQEATHHETAIQKQAEKHLFQLSSNTGIQSMLANIYCDAQCAMEIRLVKNIY
jgi:hypothetical protein